MLMKIIIIYNKHNEANLSQTAKSLKVKWTSQVFLSEGRKMTQYTAE